MYYTFVIRLTQLWFSVLLIVRGLPDVAKAKYSLDREAQLGAETATQWAETIWGTQDWTPPFMYWGENQPLIVQAERDSDPTVAKVKVYDLRPEHQRSKDEPTVAGPWTLRCSFKGYKMYFFRGDQRLFKNLPPGDYDDCMCLDHRIVEANFNVRRYDQQCLDLVLGGLIQELQSQYGQFGTHPPFSADGVIAIRQDDAGPSSSDPTSRKHCAADSLPLLGAKRRAVSISIEIPRTGTQVAVTQNAQVLSFSSVEVIDGPNRDNRLKVCVKTGSDDVEVDVTFGLAPR